MNSQLAIANHQNNTQLQEYGSTSSGFSKERLYRQVYGWSTEEELLVTNTAWSNVPKSESFIFAISELDPTATINKVKILCLKQDRYDETIQILFARSCPYPITKILWSPRSLAAQTETNLIAINSDKLTISSIQSHSSINDGDNQNSWIKNQFIGRPFDINHDLLGLKLQTTLTNRESNSNTPSTSFDWNELDPRYIVTSGLDTVCTIWDLEINKPAATISKSTISNQIVAHDHEVYDVSFSRLGSGREIFVSVGGDACLRLFDTRQLSSSSLLYKSKQRHRKATQPQPLVRVECNKLNPNMIATFALESSEIILIDVRKPRSVLAKLTNHKKRVNCISWASHSPHHLCSGSNDNYAMIWDLTKLPDVIDEPILAYRAGDRINAISWSQTHPGWISVGHQNQLELLRV